MFSRLNSNNKLLFKNTIMLYILQFSAYVFSFITVPYQTRILGAELYGLLGVATAVMMYFQLFMDFGFLLSATEDVSKHPSDISYISKKLTAITLIKLLFAIICFSIMTVLCFTVAKFSAYKALYFLYLASFVVGSFLPDYIYRGLEQMTTVTVRTVLIRLFACVMTFVLLRSKEDYLIVPLLLLMGNAAAVLVSYVHLFRSMHIRFTKITMAELFSDLKRSSTFFYSRIASTVYTATNTVVLGMVDQTGIITGCYTSADKVVALAKNGLSPISDSLYPYMVRHRDFKLVKKLLLLFMPIIILGCGVVAIFAKPLCLFAFGEGFEGAADILRAFLPVVIATLPNYIFGFPTLGAMGLSRYANYSIFVGSALHLIGLTLLLVTNSLTGVSLAVMTSISEWSILIYRVIVVYKNRVKMKG